MKRTLFIYFCIPFLFLWPKISLSQTLRALQNINNDWEYLEKNLSDVNELSKQTQWQTIDLPHTWNRWDAVQFTPGYRRDASWYRKRLPALPDCNNCRFLLYFEGSNITTEVYVNQQFAGRHIGGYVGFEIDITSFLNKNTDNEIAVRVDNSYNPDIIPSQKSDFTIYGGITRDVWLKIVPENYIRQVHISTPQVNEKIAATQARIYMSNSAIMPVNSVIRCEILEPGSNKVVAISEQILNSNTTDIISNITLPELKNPRLWSPDTPVLYQMRVRLLINNTLIDEIIEPFGYRWYHFDPHGAFYLNGKRLLIRGTHRHEDHAGYGAALPNELHRRDMEMIKEMGANFVRLGHYPQDPEVYKACNELGLIVWDELPWCRGGKGGARWESHTKRLLREQIMQNYNHASIFFWSLGNEIYWLPDFPNGDDTTQLNNFLKTLHHEAHRLDPHRMTALRKYYEGAHIVDVFSPSIWSGWYAGVYKNYAKTIEQERQKYSRFLHMEYGGDSHVGRHTETPVTGDGLVNEDEWTEVINQANLNNIAQQGDWGESYIVDLFDWYLSVSETTTWFAGNAQWAFKDFTTPLRPENPIPFVNQKGLVDRAGQPKAAYYVFKSYWSKNPFTYLYAHTWTERSGPASKPRQVKVFSNCEQVALWHNGKSLGYKNHQVGQFPANGLHWDVQFASGDNILIANGFKDKKLIASDTLRVQYAYEKHGNAHEIVLRAKPLPNGNQLIEALMLDEQGRRVLDYEARIYFSHDGAGKLLVDYGTPTRSQVIEMANGRACIELVPAAGRAVVEVRNQDFKGSYLVLHFDADGKVVNKNKKTQALLLTQPFHYDVSDRNKVTGAYVAQQRVKVPPQLASQNKWVMFEGPVLENDLIAYRFYMDNRHRNDIYGKRVNDLVMDTVSWQYHDIMDWGSDILKVGESLGIGSPGIWYQDSLHTLTNVQEKIVEITENSDTIASVRTTFRGVRIGEHVLDVVQDWSLMAGQAWSEIRLEVTNGTLPPGMYFATGIVKHIEDCKELEINDYRGAWTWGRQSFHHENMGMGLTLPLAAAPRKVPNRWSHLYIFEKADQQVHYRFLAAWERDVIGVTDAEGFQELVEQACNHQ